MRKDPNSEPGRGLLNLSALVKIVRAHRCLLIRLNDSDYYQFLSRAGLARPFTMAVPLGILEDTRTPTLCFVYGDELNGLGREGLWGGGHLGVLKRKRRLTAIEHGINIVHALPIDPPTLKGLRSLIRDVRSKRFLSRRLAGGDSVLSLPPDLSEQLVRALASRKPNRSVLRRLSADMTRRSGRSALRQLQADAIEAAVEIFGLRRDTTAVELDLPANGDTELAEYWLREDPVIEHDARRIPGFELTSSDVTGRALFRREHEVLEVITANRQPLERVLGVDLIYHNLVQENLVMVQYKMLDPAGGSSRDWIYRPDRQLAKEIARMSAFSKSMPAPPRSYRLNSQMFYLKFVRRDAIGSRAAITLPLEHFQKIPRISGQRGARRVGYRALNGAYLRDDAFYGLIRAGYIGSHSNTTASLLPLINALVAANRAVVVAVQTALPRSA